MQITRIQGFERYLILRDGTIYDTFKNKLVNATWSKRNQEYQVRLYDEKNKPHFKKIHRLLMQNFKSLKECKYVLFKDLDKRNIELDNLCYAEQRTKANRSNIEPIYTISAYQEIRDTLVDMELQEINKNINDEELEELVNELLSHQQTRELIKSLLTSKDITL